MKLIASTTTLALLSTQTAANKWGAKKCKIVKKYGEVSGDCDNELIACSRAKAVTDPEYQNCVNIKTMAAYWNPPRFSVCIEKYAEGADRDTCNTDYRTKVVACHQSSTYYQSMQCVALSAFIDTLEALPTINTPTAEELADPFWRIQTPCQAFNYASISPGANKYASTSQSLAYNRCQAAYGNAVTLEIACKGGDTSSCDAWYNLLVDLPGGQPKVNPYAPAMKVKQPVVYCDGLAEPDLTICNSKVATLPLLKENCQKEQAGDITQNGACQQFKAVRKEVSGDRPSKQLTYEVCTTDHWYFGADTATCQATVDELNTARTNCDADETHADCQKIRDLKNQISPKKTSDNLCENADNVAQCQIDAALIDQMQADCQAEIDGDVTKQGACKDLKAKRKQIGNKGDPLHEKFKAPKRNLCDGAADAAACEANVATLKGLKRDCRAEVRGDATKVGSCDTYEAQKTALFPDEFPAKDPPRDYCADETDPTLLAACQAKQSMLATYQADCQAERQGDITKSGACDLLIAKRRELMPEKVVTQKPVDPSECDDAADNAACLVILDEIQALRPQCIAENNGDLTMAGKCAELNAKRNELRPREGYVDQCTGVADEAACRALQAEIDNLVDDCKTEKKNGFSTGKCAELKTKKREIRKISMVDPCDSLDAADIQPCKDAAAVIGQHRSDCRAQKAAGIINPQACADFAAANDLIPSTQRTRKPKNLCGTLDDAAKVGCEAAYTELESLWDICAQHKKEGTDATSVECTQMNAAWALLPARKTKEEKAAELAARPPKVHPCDTLATQAEIDVCMGKYALIKSLKASCIADRKAGNKQSTNCENLKTAMADPDLPQPDKSHKQAELASTGGIILGRRRRSIGTEEIDEFLELRSGKTLSYRR